MTEHPYANEPITTAMVLGYAAESLLNDKNNSYAKMRRTVKFLGLQDLSPVLLHFKCGATHIVVRMRGFTNESIPMGQSGAWIATERGDFLLEQTTAAAVVLFDREGAVVKRRSLTKNVHMTATLPEC